MDDPAGNSFQRVLKSQASNRYWKVKLSYPWRSFWAKLFYPVGLVFYVFIYLLLVLTA